MANNSIIIVTCGHFEKKVIQLIQEDIEKEFRCSTTTSECTLDISKHYNPGRRQYDADAILNYISDLKPVHALKSIGLFRIDLYIPILTYIFGQGMLDGQAGIASLYRLRNELYGLDPNNELLITRFRKVIIHEMGHMFGLIHCHHPECVMRSSTYMEDIDQKEKKFCSSCISQLHFNLDHLYS